MKRWMNRFDGMLFACALCCSAALFVAQLAYARPNAAYAEITRNGEWLYTLPLNRGDEVVVTDGEDFVEVTVKDGGVFVARASCRDQLCVRRGRVKKAGQSIVCLPNRVAIALTGGEEDAPDAVLY